MKLKLIISIVFLFSLFLNAGQRFAVIGDPHIHINRPERLARLSDAIMRLNLNNNTLGVDFIVIVGDIAFDEWGFEEAKKIFLNSQIPCIPLIGDNEFQQGVKADYFNTFNSYYVNTLTNKISGLEIQDASTKCNLAFNSDGVKYVILDNCTNAENGVLDRTWLEQKVNEGSRMRWYPVGGSIGLDHVNNTIIFSHHPLTIRSDSYAFSSSDIDFIDNTDSRYKSTINSNFCGHTHITFGWTEDHIFWPMFDTYCTEALFNLKTSAPMIESANEFADIINNTVIPLAGSVLYFLFTGDIILLPEVSNLFNATDPGLTGMDLLNWADGKWFTSNLITISIVDVYEEQKRLAAGIYKSENGYLHTLDNQQTDVGTDLPKEVYTFSEGLYYKQWYTTVQYIQFTPTNPVSIYSIYTK